MPEGTALTGDGGSAGVQPGTAAPAGAQPGTAAPAGVQPGTATPAGAQPGTAAAGQAPAGGQWFDSIVDENLKAAASKFESEDKFLEAMGLEAEDGAPEAYTDFKLPEGMEADKEALGTFQKVAQELDLSQGQAQKLVDFQAKFMSDFVSKQAKAWNDQTANWLKEAKADKEIGGANFQAKVEKGKAAITKFGSGKFTQLLDTYGLGNHPEVIRFMSKVGEELGEDTITTDGKPAGEAKSRAERLFPNHPRG